MSRTVRGTELYGSDRCPGSEPLVCIHPSVCCGVQKIEDFWFQSPPQDVKWVLLSSSRALKMALKRAHHKKVRAFHILLYRVYYSTVLRMLVAVNTLKMHMAMKKGSPFRR